MTGQERISAIIQGKITDRIGIMDYPWSATIRRWRKEGFPQDADAADYFGYDMGAITYDMSFMLPEEKLDEDEEYTTIRNRFGMTEKIRKDETCPPMQLEPLVNSLEKWSELRQRMSPSRERYGTLEIDWEIRNCSEHYANLRRKGLFVSLFVLDPFEWTWRFWGFDRLLLAFYDAPDLICEMFDACVDQILGTYALMVEDGLVCDAVFVGGDIAYRNGPLFSRDTYRKFLLPRHKRLFEEMKKQGVRVIYHTDGDVRPLLPDLLEAGIEVLQPLETRAGMDLLQLKRDYGDRLVLFGGISAEAAERGGDAVRKEVENKLPAAKQGGRYIYCIDHSVPPTVSFENYVTLMDLVAEHAPLDGKPASRPSNRSSQILHHTP